MKVGIFESEHFESAYPVIKFFDLPANELYIFTTPETYNRFAGLFKEDMQKYQWIVVKGSRLQFFSRLREEVKKVNPGIFFINTISNNHFLFARLIKQFTDTRVIVTVHDINCMFRTGFSFNLKKLVRNAGKKSIAGTVKEYNVISDTMTGYFNEITRGQKIIHNIPGAVFEKGNTPATITGFIHLVVPGSVDKKRRNYDEVFELAELAGSRKLKLQLTILGGYRDEYGKSVIQKARAFSSGFVTFCCYDTEIVEQEEYERQLNSAHFVYIPSVIHTAICDNIPETYGVTKSSGNIFDAVKHAKPFLIPQPLQVPANLQSSGYRYASVNDIARLLEQLLQEKESYRHWQQKALHNSEAYTIEKIRENNKML